MLLDIPVKHSLSNIYIINEFTFVPSRKVIGFLLSDDNILYINKFALTQYYSLNQPIKSVRKETLALILDDLNNKISFDNCKIDALYEGYDETNIRLYPLNHTFIDSYVKKVDIQLGESYFPKKEKEIQSEIDLSVLSFELRLNLGKLFIPYHIGCKKNEIYILNPLFQGVSHGNVIFDFLLGLDEIMVIEKGGAMSLESKLGEAVVTDPSGLGVELTVSLGELSFSLAELQDLVVGDFIDLKDLSTSKIELRMKNTLLAYGELVYNENKQLAVEVKEVFI